MVNPDAGRLYSKFPHQYPIYFIESRAPSGKRSATWTHDPNHATAFETEEAAHECIQWMNLEQFRPLSDFGLAVFPATLNNQVKTHAERRERESKDGPCRVKLCLCFSVGEEVVAPSGRRADGYPYYFVGQPNQSHFDDNLWDSDVTKATVFPDKSTASHLAASVRQDWHNFNRVDEAVQVEWIDD